MAEDPHLSCRFYVQIDGLPSAVFTEATGLQMETDVTNYPEGGQNDFVHRLPGRTQFGNIVLKRGFTRSNEFFAWYIENTQGSFSTRHISIIAYSITGEEIARWDFMHAFPVRWVGPEFRGDNSLVAVETVELAHSGLGS